MELLLEPDEFWPEISTSAVGIKDSCIVPPDSLSDPELITFDGSYTVVTPGWIDSHAHLELSGVDDISFNGSFTDWIWDVLDFKTSLADDQIRKDFREGCQELIESGVARAVDHCDRTDLTVREIEKVGLDVIPYKELIAFTSDSIQELKDEVSEFFTEISERDIDAGLAPHAPYSAHPDLYEWAEKQSITDGRLSSHLHEVRGELEFAENGTGPMQELLEQRNDKRIESPYEGDRPIPFFLRNKYFSEPIFGVHMNYLNNEDIRWLESSNIRPVFCPKSYSYFEHDTLPVEDWFEKSVDFALGTDSLASNNSLNMLDELRKLNDMTDKIPPEYILKALTSIPANTIGMPDRGVLTWGTPADFSVFDVPSRDLDDLGRGQAEPRAVIIDGEVCWSSSNLPK